MVIYHGLFKVKDNRREDYISEILESGLIEKFRLQKGNLFYSVAASVTDKNILVVCDGWATDDDYQSHVDSDAVKEWHEIYNRFVCENDYKEYRF